MNDGSATILVVDDEPAILVMASMILQRRGYTALLASSALEALTVLESRADVSLVLTDCNMPGISGPELDEIILARWPHIPIIAMSGRPRLPELQEGIEFINKPFRGANLTAMIERALDRRRLTTNGVPEAAYIPDVTGPERA